MKLEKDALLVILDIFRKGLTEGKDISDLLRNLELQPNSNGNLSPVGYASNSDAPNTSDVWVNAQETD